MSIIQHFSDKPGESRYTPELAKELESSLAAAKAEIERLRGAIAIASENCLCTLSERMQGHHMNCNMPYLLYALRSEPSKGQGEIPK